MTTEDYVLWRLEGAIPHGRTFKELQWWCTTDSIDGLKDCLHSLKRKGWITYVDPTGWRINLEGDSPAAKRYRATGKQLRNHRVW